MDAEPLEEQLYFPGLEPPAPTPPAPRPMCANCIHRGTGFKIGKLTHHLCHHPRAEDEWLEFPMKKFSDSCGDFAAFLSPPDWHPEEMIPEDYYAVTL